MENLSERKIRDNLRGKIKDITIITQKKTTSTNECLKRLFLNGECPENTFFCAEEQTQGRGRLGRSFFSPEETGIYMSLVIKPDFPVRNITSLTPLTAVAVCRALEKCGSSRLKIKWVNDIFNAENKKVCGILCESVFTGGERPECVIIGAGINLYEPKNGFPESIKNTAGAVFKEDTAVSENRIAAEFLNCFFALYENFSGDEAYEEYKNRCFVTGKTVKFKDGDETVTGTAEKIGRDFSLTVKTESGEYKNLFFGEVGLTDIL